MRFLLPLGFCVFVGSCALAPGEDSDPLPLAILDAYLIAHGMAASTVARDAVRTLTRSGEGFADEGATARAVSALTDYAARQTSLSP
jgi:hypothetical protein